MSHASRTRRLHFSLRTMFVLFTAAAMWLGWNAHVVSQRRAIVAEAQWSVLNGSWWRERPPSIPWVRRLMGDEPVLMLTLSDIEAPNDILKRAERLFPEALVEHLPVYPYPSR